MATRGRALQSVTPLLGIMVFAASALLLTSVGGLGIIASPITVPAMYCLVRAHPTRPFRVAGAVIGGLTGLEGGWGLASLIRGTDDVVTWTVAIGVAALVLAAFILTDQGPQARARSIP